MTRLSGSLVRTFQAWTRSCLGACPLRDFVIPSDWRHVCLDQSVACRIVVSAQTATSDLVEGNGPKHPLIKT
jgi:hypothetical protein